MPVFDFFYCWKVQKVATGKVAVNVIGYRKKRNDKDRWEREKERDKEEAYVT